MSLRTQIMDSRGPTRERGLFMRKIAPLFLLLSLSDLCAYAQDAKGGHTVVQPPPPLKQSQPPKASALFVRPATKPLGKHTALGGYFMDFIQAERKRAMFDLTTPLNPKIDLENLSFYPRTEDVQAVILFVTTQVVLGSLGRKGRPWRARRR